MGDTTNQIAVLIDAALDPALPPDGRERAVRELIELAYHRLIRLCSTRLRNFTTQRFLPNDTGDVLEQLQELIHREWPRFLDVARDLEPEKRPRVWFGWCTTSIFRVLQES